MTKAIYVPQGYGAKINKGASSGVTGMYTDKFSSCRIMLIEGKTEIALIHVDHLMDMDKLTSAIKSIDGLEKIAIFKHVGDPGAGKAEVDPRIEYSLLGVSVKPTVNVIPTTDPIINSIYFCNGGAEALEYVNIYASEVLNQAGEKIELIHHPEEQKLTAVRKIEEIIGITTRHATDQVADREVYIFDETGCRELGKSHFEVYAPEGTDAEKELKSITERYRQNDTFASLREALFNCVPEQLVATPAARRKVGQDCDIVAPYMESYLDNYQHIEASFIQNMLCALDCIESALEDAPLKKALNTILRGEGGEGLLTNIKSTITSSSASGGFKLAFGKSLQMFAQHYEERKYYSKLAALSTHEGAPAASAASAPASAAAAGAGEPSAPAAPKPEGKGAARGTNVSANKHTAGYYSEYYIEGLEHLLALRLSDSSARIYDAVLFDGISLKFQDGVIGRVREFVETSIIDSKGPSRTPAIIPIFVESTDAAVDFGHWVGVVIENAHDSQVGNGFDVSTGGAHTSALRVTYIDPEGSPLPTSLMEALLKVLPGHVIEFVEEDSAPQSCSDNCGPEFIERAALAITGYRVPEAEAVAFHSAFYEAHLLDQALIAGNVQHATTRLMLNTPNGSTKPFDFSYDVTTGEIIDAREVSTEAASSASPATADQPTSASQSIPTLHLDGAGTIVSDFISFMQATAQHGTNLLWNLAPLIETAQTLLNKALDSKNIIMTLMLLDTVDALHSQDPFAHIGFPGRYPGGDPDDGGGYGGGGGNGDGSANLPVGSATLGPTPTFSGQSNASLSSSFNSSHALNFTGSEGDVGYAGHVANGTAGAEG